MLGERELLGLDSQLNNYILASKQHHVTQDNLLEDFQQLITDYRQLRSDYEEEKASREKYKKMARGQERDPFVLVLVDGDSYIFRDKYIKAGASGGVSAAQNMNSVIKDMLQSRLSPSEVDQCRVMVRIYANLSGLSKSLAKAGLVGQEARSLAPFTSSFTRAQDLFDFVDAGDKKDGADFKIREMFRLFAENSQCKHIFFAGCHDVGYLSLLIPYRGKADRVTLLKGLCKYGDTCLNEHIGQPETPETPENAQKVENLEKSENRLSVMQILQKYPALSVRSTAEAPVPVSSKPSDVLPENRPAEATARGRIIPVNKNGDRLEVLCEKPSADAWKAYHVRKEQHKVCNSHHLAGRCEMGPNCELDHTELSPLALTTLRFILKKNPCPKGSTCRDPTCYVGHLCQIDDCSGGSSCRFKADKHIQNLDFNVARWVEPEFAPVAPVVVSPLPSSSAAAGSNSGRTAPSILDDDTFVVHDI
ncbi:hypothetical protein PISL3812_06709 [Talaromyces islandicus]|uniref:C3H1-type domain-containing protein n=1 Tax=Talaromyces islandicus TaxID=28573 RepID=A0A0U1M3S1_TALIS|nr:hypothetical protein PISL3812_06709 [Talaromyces islandicus]